MMHRVYIEFTSPKKWFKPFSWAIRLFQGTPYSHVRLRWISTTGEELIYEASGSAVKLIGRYAQDKYAVKVHHSYHVNLDRPQYKRLIGLFRYASVDYGQWQALGIPLADVFCLKKNPLSKGQRKQVCSELVGYFIQEVLQIKVPKDFDLLIPKDIKEFLDRNLVQ